MSVADEDVGMEAPEISTLREEDTPPPTRTSKLRVKLLLGDKKGKGKSSSPSISLATRKNAQSGPTPSHSDQDVEEDEEDQLIDDDELPPASGTLAGTKRKAPAKKSRPRKMEKQDKEADKPVPGKLHFISASPYS